MCSERMIYAADALASSKINDRQLTELFAHLRGVKEKDWADLRRRLADALQRDATATAARDGFSGTSSGFAAAGGGTSGVNDSSGNTGVARAEWGERRDPLHEHTAAAVKALEAAVTAVQVLRSRLDAIDHLSDVDDQVDPAPGCWLMGLVGVWEPVHRTGDVGGRLKEPRPLGKWAYDFVRSTGELPTREQARAHAEGRRIRVKA